MFFDIIEPPLLRGYVVTLVELYEKYEAFLNHEGFPEIQSKADLILQNPNLDEFNQKKGNWEYNFIFLSNYFDTPKRLGTGIVQKADKFTIVINGAEVELNTNNAPDFMCKEDYLNWLNLNINK